MMEYEAIQHLPILREAWVLSFRGRVQTAFDKDGQQTPFFMLPALGGGSTLRGYSSWRFRDKNSLLLQAEWRMVNRYLDMAFFYDAGKVAARTSDLDLDGLKDDYGIGFRFHGPFATPLRVELLTQPRKQHRVHFSTGAQVATHAFINVFAVPGAAAFLVLSSVRSAFFRRAPARGPRFYPNDRAASRIAGRLEGGAYDQSQMCELMYNLFVTSGYEPSGLRAKNINTIDEVPDSSWFTNRIGSKPITTDEITRGPLIGAPPIRRSGC